jgi:hypothetical protein
MEVSVKGDRHGDYEQEPRQLRRSGTGVLLLGVRFSGYRQTRR